MDKMHVLERNFIIIKNKNNVIMENKALPRLRHLTFLWLAECFTSCLSAQYDNYAVASNAFCIFIIEMHSV